MNTKMELCKQIERVVGYIPKGLNDILGVLTHPDVIELTQQYIKVCAEADSTRA